MHIPRDALRALAAAAVVAVAVFLAPWRSHGQGHHSRYEPWPPLSPDMLSNVVLTAVRPSFEGYITTSRIGLPELREILAGESASPSGATTNRSARALGEALGVAFTDTNTWFWKFRQDSLLLYAKTGQVFMAPVPPGFKWGELQRRSAALTRPEARDLDRVYPAPQDRWYYFGERLMNEPLRELVLDQKRLAALLEAEPARVYVGDDACRRFARLHFSKTTLDVVERTSPSEGRCVALLKDRRVLFCHYLFFGHLLLQTEDGAACLLEYEKPSKLQGPHSD